MTTFAYYNEIDPFAAQWLRNLIAAGHIAPGDVDERSITEVHPADLLGYDQCHFFAGIGVWSYALRLAGWPDNRPVWTGSCPCQPFSAAGKQGGFDDERHLWPEFYRLISRCRRVAVFGEQVASKVGLAWLDLVYADLETAGYAVGAVDTCAAGFGAPHIRQRLYFVADSERGAAERHGHALAGTAEGMQGETRQQRLRADARDGVATGELADSESQHDRSRGTGTRRGIESTDCGADGDVGDAECERLQEQRGERRTLSGSTRANEGQAAVRANSSACNGHWSACDWLPCIDGKARPVEPGTFPLAHGPSQRVGRLRAYGNAICAPQAAEFIAAYMSCKP